MNKIESNPSIPSNAGAVVFATTALVFLALGCLMLAVRPGFLLEGTLTRAAQAWIQLMVFGFGLPAVFGAVYWALPRAFGLPLFSGQAVFLHYGFHLAGLLIAIAASFVPDLPQGTMGATFLACGGVVFIVNVAMSLRGLDRADAGSAFVSTVMVWLVAALFLGLPFAATAPLPIFGGTNWSAGWLVFVVSGVLFNAVLGLALRITPLAVGGETGQSPAAWYVLALANLGVAWMFAAATFGPQAFLLVCASVFLVGSLIYLGSFWGLLQGGTRAVFGWETKILVAAVWMIPASALALLYDIWERLGLQAPADAAAAAVPAATLAVEGPVPIAIMALDWTVGLTAILAAAVPGLVALILQLQKLRDTAAPENAEPGTRERVTDQLVLASFFNYAVGVLLVVVGAWGSEAQMLSLGAVFLVVGSSGFLGIFLYHLLQPAGAPASRYAGAAVS